MKFNILCIFIPSIAYIPNSSTNSKCQNVPEIDWPNLYRITLIFNVQHLKYLKALVNSMWILGINRGLDAFNILD